MRHCRARSLRVHRSLRIGAKEPVVKKPGFDLLCIGPQQDGALSQTDPHLMWNPNDLPNWRLTSQYQVASFGLHPARPRAVGCFADWLARLRDQPTLLHRSRAD